MNIIMSLTYILHEGNARQTRETKTSQPEDCRGGG